MTDVERFVEQLESNGAVVWRTEKKTLAACIGGAIDEFVPKKEALEPASTLLTFLDLDLSSAGIKSQRQLPKGENEIGLSQATLGICDTGTLALVSSEENPTSLNFLVDYHLILVQESDLVINLHEAMAELSQYNAWQARAVNFISGPSRTADIEQTIQLGAHGPRHLLVFIIS